MCFEAMKINRKAIQWVPEHLKESVNDKLILS